LNEKAAGCPGSDAKREGLGFFCLEKEDGK
jgi:hypothetical protein